MEHFKRDNIEHHGFGYVWDRTVAEDETVIVAMPPISANKRGVNDIAWQTESDDVVIYATISANANDALWTEIPDYGQINKCATYLKVKNNGAAARVTMRALLN